MFETLFNKYYLEIKWALLFVAMNLLWVWGEKLAGLHDSNIQYHATFTNLIAVPAIIVYLLAMWDKRKQNGGYLLFKQGFMYGLSITLIVVALSPFMIYLSFTVITPHFFEHAIQFSIHKGYMKANDAAMYFSLDSYIIQSLFGGFIIGLILSIITALAMKKTESSKLQEHSLNA